MTVHSKENTSNKVVDAGFFADLSRMEVLLQNNADIPFLKISNLIDSFADNFGMSSLRENSSLEPFLIQSYTRIATVLTNWLVFCEYDFDEHTLYYLSYRSEEFNKIFSVSGYRGFSHVINYMASENPDGSINISGVKLAYLLAILPLDELTDELFAAVDSLTEWQKSIVILGWLQSRSVLRVSGEKYRGLLLDNLDFLKRVTPNYQMLRSFLNAWMNCSYAVSKGKHKIKKILNVMIKNFLASENINAICKPYQLKNKPRMVIIHERFTRGHAMYRCYASYILSLREHFELISIGEVDKTDTFPELFDDNVQIENIDDLKPIVELIAGLQPDVIYYPSLGMSHWTICLANLRMAPVQIASAGHPATTESDEIDYMFSGDIPKSLYKTVSERLLIIKERALSVVPHEQLKNVEFTNQKWNDESFHIAINATCMKVNGELIELCRRIEARSTRKVVFHFFPAINGIEFDSFVHRLKFLLSDVVVHPTDTYPRFMDNLQKCDVSMSPFPFGNANGVFDALLCSLPVVALEGMDMAGSTDRIMLAQFSLDGHLVCNSIEEYEDRVLLLANDSDFYTAQVTMVRERSVRSHMLSALGHNDEIKLTPYLKKFGYLLRFSYDYHNQIQSSKAKAIICEEVEHANLFQENKDH